MKITAIVEALVGAGASPEMILAAVRSAEDQKDAAVDASKAKARARVQKWRDQHNSDRSNVTERSVISQNDEQRLTGEHAHVEDKTSNLEIEPQKKVPEAKRAFRLAADWTLPFDWRADALKAGLPEQFHDLEAAKMRDWSLSAPKGAKREWRPAWRNWAREAAARLPRARAGPAPMAGKDSVANAARRRLEAENGRTDESGFDDHQQVAGLISGNHIRLVG